jgi:large subunit ribosomal protein L18
MYKKHHANEARLRRHRRVRKRVSGTPARPRLAVFRSGTNIYAQVIDDNRGVTLLAASSIEPDYATRAKKGVTIPDGDELADALKGLTKNKRVQQAWLVGEIVAERAKAKGISKVVFDRGGYVYHGRVAAVAEGARHGGLEF